MSAPVDPSALRTGRVRGRYFRENFAHRAHEKLMSAFLDPEVYEGSVHIRRDVRANAQASLIEEM